MFNTHILDDVAEKYSIFGILSKRFTNSVASITKKFKSQILKRSKKNVWNKECDYQKY
jgi:hypothetical protein